MDVLTRRQREIFNFLHDNYDSFAYPPSLDQLCSALGMASRGSLYKHIMVLIEAGLVSRRTLESSLCHRQQRSPIQVEKCEGHFAKQSGQAAGIVAGAAFFITPRP